MLITKQRKTWAVMFILLACLAVLNFTDGLQRDEPAVYDAFMQVFGFNPLGLTAALDNHDFGGILLAGMQTITYQFVHMSLLHFTMNVYFLALLGMRVERYLGGLCLVAFYLAAGIVGALATWVMNFESAVPMIGASGAIAGCIGGYAALVIHDRRRRDYLGWLGLLVVGKFLFDQFAMASGFYPSGDGTVTIAVGAHLAGFAFGYLVLYLTIRRNRRPVITPVRIEPDFFAGQN